MKPRKRKRALRVYEPNSGAATSDWFVRCQRAMRELERTGSIEDAALRKRIREGWDPAVEISIMSARPNLPEFLEFACLKILVERQQRTAELREKSRESSDVKITIVVPPWASGGNPPASALPAPDETIIEADMPRTNGTPATPMLSDRERLRRQVAA